MENERLQQRVAQLRLQSQALDGASERLFTTSDNFDIAAARTNFDAVGPSPVADDDADGPRKKVRFAAYMRRARC